MENNYEVALREHAETYRYIGTAGIVILFYDHFLSFTDEVEYIWSAKHTFPKFLFLFVRYLVPCALVLHIYQLLGSIGTDNIDTVSCQTWFTLAVCLGILSTGIGNFLVLLRLWVLWKRNGRLIVSTLLLFILAQTGIVACAIVVLVRVSPSFSYDPILQLCTLQRRSILGALYAPPVILDGIALLAVSWNALACPRRNHTVLVKHLYTDKFGYILVLFLMRLVNLGTTLFAPLHVVFIGICFIWATTTVTVSRLIIDLRKQAIINPKSVLPLPQQRPAYNLPFRVSSASTGSVSSTLEP